jgi:hypothetical protein
MSLVLVFTASVEFCRSDSKWGFASICLAVISFFILKHLRWQRIQMVYEYYVALHAISEGDPDIRMLDVARSTNPNGDS